MAALHSAALLTVARPAAAATGLCIKPLSSLHRPLTIRRSPCCYPASFPCGTASSSPLGVCEQRLVCVGRNLAKVALVAVLGFSLALGGINTAEARPEGVNRPELLPKYFTPVIDIAGFLSAGQEQRLKKELLDLEEVTGIKLRVLAQNYPDTPGLAIKDYWQVDDNTIVFVADHSFGNFLNFNVGAAVDMNVPVSFWTHLAGIYGTTFYWQEKGEDSAIEAAVSAISSCLRESPRPHTCANIQ
eukprot:c16645_g1_i1 orf=307-1038(-)